jgi:two-component system nitrogen regulation response regulator GlnG
MSIHLPALRERNGDVRRIAQHFVRLYAERFGKRARELSDDALELLHRYPWPGNVRELESAIKSAVVLADDVVRAEHLPPEIRGSGSLQAEVLAGLDLEHAAESLLERGLRSAEIDLKAFGAEAAEQAERLLLEALVRRPHMSGARMAKMLNVDPKTLRVKLRKFGLGQN